MSPIWFTGESRGFRVQILGVQMGGNANSTELEGVRYEVWLIGHGYRYVIDPYSPEVLRELSRPHPLPEVYDAFCP